MVMVQMLFLYLTDTDIQNSGREKKTLIRANFILTKNKKIIVSVIMYVHTSLSNVSSLLSRHVEGTPLIAPDLSEQRCYPTSQDPIFRFTARNSQHVPQAVSLSCLACQTSWTDLCS